MSESTGTHTEREFDYGQVMARFGEAIGVSTKAGIARALGMKVPAFHNREKSRSIPWEYLVPECLRRGFDVAWIVTGRERPPAGGLTRGDGTRGDGTRGDGTRGDGTVIDARAVREAGPSYQSGGVNAQLLANAIEAVESLVADAGYTPTLMQRAYAIAAAYGIAAAGVDLSRKTVDAVMEGALNR